MTMKITQDIINKIDESYRPANYVLKKIFSKELNDFDVANPKLATESPLKKIMASNGITGDMTIRNISTAGAGDWLLPVYIDTVLRETVAEDSMLNYVTSSVITSPTAAILSATIDLTDKYNKDGTETKRVTEGADIPLASIKTGKAHVEIFKRGRAVEATYESISDMRIDLFKMALDLISRDISDQQMGDAIHVLVNGDGNTYNGTDPNIPKSVATAAADKITEDDLLNIIKAFQKQAKLPITTIIANGTFFDQLWKMRFKDDLTNGANNRFLINAPQFSGQSVNLILDERVPKTADSKQQAIFLNSNFALNKYIVANSNIQEFGTNIRNQTQLGTFTERAGFAKFNNYASMVLTSK